MPRREQAQDETAQAIRIDAISELEAVNLYQAHLNAISDPDAREVLSHVRDGEKEHFAEFLGLLERLDPEQARYLRELEEGEGLVLPSVLADIEREIDGIDREVAALLTPGDSGHGWHPLSVLGSPAYGSIAEKELWQMTKAEYQLYERTPMLEAIHAALAAGKPLYIRTYLRATKITKPEHIKLTRSGEPVTPSGRNWTYLIEGQFFDLASQAGVKIPSLAERRYHEDIVKEALKQRKPVPEEVLAEYPDLAKKGRHVRPDLLSESDGTELPAGVRFNPALTSEARTLADGTIEVGPKYLDLPDEARHKVLIHEQAHAARLDNAAMDDPEFWRLLQEEEMFGPLDPETGEILRGINGQFKPGENVVEGYAVLMTEPEWLQTHFPKAYEYIRLLAQRQGLPVGSSMFPAVAKDDIDELIAQYELTGRVAYRYPRKRQISLDGRTMAEADAVKKMQEILSTGTPRAERVYPLTQPESLGNLLDDMGARPGTVVDTQLAVTTKCTRVDLGPGRKPLVYSSGIIGALDEAQQDLYCREGYIDTEHRPELLSRLEAIPNAARVCSEEISAIGDPQRQTEVYLSCLRRELLAGGN